MKNLIKKIRIVTAAFIIISLFIVIWVNNSTEKEQLKTNFEIELNNIRERQQQLTGKELKTFHKDITDTLQNYGIKPKQVENIVKISYRYKDSVIPKYELIFRDTIIKLFDTSKIVFATDINVATKCNIIKGNIIDNVLTINSIETTDTLLISLYKEKRKCLFRKRGIKAIAISQCKGDTLTILNNLKIK